MGKDNSNEPLNHDCLNIFVHVARTTLIKLPNMLLPNLLNVLFTKKKKTL